MKNMNRIIILFLLSITTIEGFGQSADLPIVDKVIYTYLDSLIKNKEFESKDTLLIIDKFKIDSLLIGVSNFKIITTDVCSYLNDNKGTYFILRYKFVNLKADSLLIRILLNRATPGKKFPNSCVFNENEDLNFTSDYWIKYDCEVKEWRIKK